MITVFTSSDVPWSSEHEGTIPPFPQGETERHGKTRARERGGLGDDPGGLLGAGFWHG
jgi:hypothetical protein